MLEINVGKLSNYVWHIIMSGKTINYYLLYIIHTLFKVLKYITNITHTNPGNGIIPDFKKSTYGIIVIWNNTDINGHFKIYIYIRIANWNRPELSGIIPITKILHLIPIP